MDALVELDKQFMTSLAFIAVSMAIGELLRWAIKEYFSNEEEGNKNWNRVFLLEIAMQFERVSTTAEIVFVLSIYGRIMAYVLMVLRNIWQAHRWEPTKSNMHAHVLKLIDGKEDLLEAVALSSIETVTSMLTYPIYLKPFWTWFDNQPDRWPKAHKQCQSRMKGGLFYGSLAEGVGGFACQWVGLVFMAASLENKAVRSWLQTTIMFGFIVVSVDISGGYFNPPSATGAQAGCENVVLHEHLICYWFAPIAGAATAAFLFRKLFGTPEEQKRD